MRPLNTIRSQHMCRAQSATDHCSNARQCGFRKESPALLIWKSPCRIEVLSAEFVSNESRIRAERSRSNFGRVQPKLSEREDEPSSAKIARPRTTSCQLSTELADFVANSAELAQASPISEQAFRRPNVRARPSHNVHRTSCGARNRWLTTVTFARQRIHMHDTQPPQTAK